MNSYLLDTHTAIWYFQDNPALSKTADAIIFDFSNKVYISIASAWEVAIKMNIGKLNFKGGIKEFLHLIDKNKIDIIPILPEHLLIYETLPLHHRDPFDRLLVATAISENFTLVSDDTHISKYDVSCIW